MNESGREFPSLLIDSIQKHRYPSQGVRLTAVDENIPLLKDPANREMLEGHQSCSQVGVPVVQEVEEGLKMSPLLKKSQELGESENSGNLKNLQPEGDEPAKKGANKTERSGSAKK